MDSVIRKVLVRLGYFLMPHLSSTDTFLISQYMEKLCLKDLLEGLRVNCVLDVGANQGQYARSLRKLGYEGHIMSFEPNPDQFALLYESLERDSLWRGFQIALGGENTERAFNITGSSKLSSFLEPRRGQNLVASDRLEIVRVDKAKVRRLDSILDSLLKLVEEPRLFLKMDTQGYDLEVIEGAEGCLDKILGLQSELSVRPIYEAMPSYIEALKMYQSLGFSLVALFPVAYDRRGNAIEYDCIMERSRQCAGN